MATVNSETLAKINKFTRRELTADEVFCFSVILCDNEIDRDNEKFSVDALNKLAQLYVGKTGIFNHDPKGENQTARIYDTAVIRDETRKTADREVYTYLQAEVYMVKTEKNADLIKEIDGGIKKEVSVGCAVEREICSICGKDRRTNPCNHRKGASYGGKKCFGILNSPTDAYEWSFVAVPAQRNAGVTKRYGEDYANKGAFPEEVSLEAELYNELTEDLKREIIRLSYLEGDSVPVTLTKAAIARMDISELMTLKKALASQTNEAQECEISAALEKKQEPENNKSFKL